MAPVPRNVGRPVMEFTIVDEVTGILADPADSYMQRCRNIDLSPEATRSPRYPRFPLYSGHGEHTREKAREGEKE